MIPMPETYLPYADIRRCGLQVTFEMVDVDAAETAEVAVSNACEMAQITQTHDRTEHPSCRYASLEQDYWRLDGSFLLPEQEKLPLQQTGWWSDRISGADGVFDTPPILRFSWNADQSSAGFTVCFDTAGEQYVSRFRLCAYDADGVLLKDVLVENIADRCELDVPVEHYRTITLEFLQTHAPFRRVRVTEVIFGLIKRFTQENTLSATLDYSFSPIGESLPTNELTLTIDNSDASWNMANPKGVYAYLQQTQPLDISLTIGEDSVYMGRFYFTTASAGEDHSERPGLLAGQHKMPFGVDRNMDIGTGRPHGSGNRRNGYSDLYAGGAWGTNHSPCAAQGLLLSRCAPAFSAGGAVYLPHGQKRYAGLFRCTAIGHCVRFSGFKPYGGTAAHEGGIGDQYRGTDCPQ